MRIDVFNLSEHLSRQVMELIREKDLSPGDAIPSSRALAQQFEVTTPTMREALRRLEVTGMIEFRHGSGTYVGESLNKFLLSNPFSPDVGAAAALELAETRLLIEPGIAGVAAAHRTDAALLRMETALKNALVPPQAGNPPKIQFHREMAAATGNSLMHEMVDALLRVRGVEQHLIRELYDDRKQDHAEHAGILEAIAASDVDEATRLTRQHLTHIRDAVSSVLESSTR